MQDELKSAPAVSVDAPTMTLGEFRVGINFNVGGHAAVDKFKRMGADFIDAIEAERRKVDDPLCGELFRLYAHAQTLIEDATMNAVKGVTKNTKVTIIRKP